MGQIVSAAAKPKRCNKNQLSQLGVLEAGLHVLVSSDNSMNAAGQGNFDAYVVGDGRTTATALELKSVEPKINLDEKVDIHIGKNLLNLDSVTEGKFINTNGVFLENNSYSVSDFIKVEEGETYYLSCLSGNTIMSLGTASACVNLYDSSKALVSTVGGDSRTLTVPAGIAYIRVSIVNAYTEKQIEVGTARSTYEPYNPIGGYLSGVVSDIEDVKDDLVQLEQNVIPVDRTNSHTYTGNAIYYFWEDLDIKQGTKFILRIDGTATWGTNGAWIVSNLGTGLPGITMVKATGEDHEITASGDITKIGFRLYNYTTAGTITMRLIVPNSVYELLAKKVEIKPGKNLYNEDTNTRGCYLSSTGTLTNNTSYSVTDFIPVVSGQTYYCTGLRSGIANPLGSGSAYAAYYDANRQFVSSTPGDDRGHTIPSGVSYMRLSVTNNLTEVQIEVGAARSAYEQYTPIGGYPAKIPNGTVTMEKLSQGVQDAINAGGVPVFSSSRNSGTLAPTEILRAPLKCHIIKNALLVAKITGTIDKVSVGVGIKSDGTPNYQSYWAVIDQTNIKIYWYNNVEDTLVATYPHGITLTNKTTLWVDTSVGASQSVKLTLQDDLGNMFTQELSDWGMGVAFVRNDNTSGSLDIDLSFMPRDITKKIWLFGDSYFSYVSNAKWTYYLMADNLTDWLSNNLPGLSPASGYEDLGSLLSLGHTPSYLVWCLGMNGATTEEQEGGVYVINPAQKEVIDNVISACQQYGITPVLATIPTVPTRQKTGFCNYVRSLGVRYIDFAEAVGTNSSGVWNTGLLSSDGVHPTAAGAKVLLTRVLLDFPEIGLVD